MTKAKIIAASVDAFLKANSASLMVTKVPLTGQKHQELKGYVKQEMLRASVTYGRRLDEPLLFGDSPYRMIKLPKTVADEEAQRQRDRDDLAIRRERERVIAEVANRREAEQRERVIMGGASQDPLTIPWSLIAQNQVRKDGSVAFIQGNTFVSPTSKSVEEAIATDYAMNHATVVMGEPHIRADDGIVVIVASVNRYINGATCPPEWTLAHGNETNNVVLQLAAFIQLGVAKSTQIIGKEGQSTFMLELKRPGKQYTVWFRPTPSSSKFDCRTFKF